MRGLALCALLLSLWGPLASAQLATVVRVPITADEKRKLDTFVHGRDILQITDYTSPDLDSIGPVEQFIFRKAVLLGGLKARFQDELVPNSVRAREETRLGSVVCSGAAQWHMYYQEEPDGLFESDVVIANGAYEKGLYTTQEKARQLRVERLDDLRSLTAVSSDTWVIDWATLQKLPLRAVYSGANRAAQFRMVEGQRADFTLQDFAATPDMGIEEQGVRLYPIPGVKIALLGSRHFFVSKNHPDGEKVFAALQRGLKIMRQSGEIDRILAQSGFSSARARNWTLLNR